MDWISPATAVFSLAVAVWVAVLTRRQNRLDRRLVEIEESRESRERRARQSADLKVTCRPGRQSSTYELEVSNQGQAAARDVQVEIGQLPENQVRGPKPGFSVAPGSHVSYNLLVAAQGPNSAPIRVSWEDDAGGGESETTVSFIR